MRRNIFTFFLFVLILFTTLLPSPTTRAGDIIDFLPEVQVARSLSVFLSAIVDPNTLGLISCFGRTDEVEQFPDHLLIDDLGDVRSEEEAVELARQAYCAFNTIEVIEDDFIFFGAGKNLMVSVIQGRTVRSAQGVLIDGSKQLNRVAALAILSEASLEQLVLALGGRPGNECELFEEGIVNAETLELRFLFMATATLDSASAIAQQNALGIPAQSAFDCDLTSNRPLEELTAAAQLGDARAALHRAGLEAAPYIQLILEGVGETELALIENEIPQRELSILTNTERFPLVALGDAALILVLNITARAARVISSS